MELREAAEQILFATTLEDKLRSPDIVTDEHPGPARAAPASPGRPRELQFKPAGGAPAEFPGVHRLQHPVERGRLLHFFANHELLATELMALVLLRFPEAPPAFRRGVWKTLREEQAHTRRYLERLRAHGLAFGDLPVSGYFWRAVSPMASPTDYVAGLSLTFEQANLDYCRHFGRLFAAAGDTATAALLEQIHHDEIAHVAYGLKWFRRWKRHPEESDWDAFCRELRFPLSPSRAKGVPFNHAARQAAGLDAHFIAALNVHAQSKGRTPNVFFFNPLTEGRLARGRAFSPVQAQADLAYDLENLPQFLARRDDLVLVETPPAVPFLSTLKQAGFDLPEFVAWARDEPAVPPTLQPRRLGGLRPWAWGPEALERLGPLWSQVTGDRREPEACFNPAIAQLYAKAWSAEFLHGFLRAHRDEPWWCHEDEVGIAVRTLDDALDVIRKIRARGHHRIVVKESLGSAGHNALRLWEPDLLPAQRRWMTAVLEAGLELVIEPWLEREIDFSLQLEADDRGLHLCGYTLLQNDRKGQFLANEAGPQPVRRLPPGVLAALASAPGFPRGAPDLFAPVRQRLAEALLVTGYRGPVGVDAFLYRTSRGELRLKPVVEINPRHTMGRLTLELMRHVCPGSSARFRLLHRPALRALGAAGFPEYARQLGAASPVRLEGEPVPRIRAGAVCLNDPGRARSWLAVLEVTARTAPARTDAR